MREKKVATASYIISIIFLIIYILLELNSNIELSEISRLLIICIISLFLYFGGLFISKYKQDNKAMKINLYIFFILYLILLITLTLFDPMWGRNGIKIPNWSFDNLKMYLENNCNIIPFKTITTYISQFNSLYSTKQILLNLFGNIFAFAPTAFFLPLIFKSEKNIKNFTITLVIMILGIEILQLLTHSGRFDIDDLILNLSGAIITYLLINIKSVNNLIKNIFLLENNKIEKKAYIKIFLVIIVFIILFTALILYRKYLYNKNLEEFNKKYNPDISFKYDKKCSENNLFYEDKNYKYYFECYDNDKFKVIVNKNEKLTIQELCDSNKYSVDIDRILSIMDYNKIKYKIENK